MSRVRLANLLDDFGFGGVARGIAVFESPIVRRVADARTVPVAATAVLAPKLDADVIITHFPPNWRRLLLLASLRLRNPSACIVHVEHSYTAAWETLKVRHPQRFRLMLKLALRLVDHVVCVSHGQAEWLRAVAALPATRVSVIQSHTHNPGLDSLALPGFAADRPLVIGAYGRFHEQKGFDTLIAAYRAGAMRGTQLLIGGFGPDEAQLRALAGDHPGIRFAGRIDDVAGFLNQVDIVAVPSRWEAFGQVATEAREAGRPILVAPVDGLPEQVGDAGLMVDFADHAALRAALATLDANRLAAMATAARAATAGCGDDRRQHWADLILKLVGGSRLRAA
jgi:glycosyltransferase involved in cell wall biosynthesis